MSRIPLKGGWEATITLISWIVVSLGAGGSLIVTKLACLPLSTGWIG